MRKWLLRSVSWWAALLVVSCADAPVLPEGVEVIAGSSLERMLEQCSRDTPLKGEGTWQPETSDIRQFEAQLSAELPSQLDKVNWQILSERKRLNQFPTGFWREYVGIVREGRRYIYGSFGPITASAWTSTLTEGPTIVCDGGPVYFGAEHDTTSKTITHWAFNGSF